MLSVKDFSFHEALEVKPSDTLKVKPMKEVSTCGWYLSGEIYTIKLLPVE